MMYHLDGRRHRQSLVYFGEPRRIWPRAKLAGLRLTPADFAGRRRRTPQDLGRILAGPGTGPSGPPVLLEGPIRVTFGAAQPARS